MAYSRKIDESKMNAPFASRLRALLEETGCGLQRVADYAGVSTQAISAYQTGESVPKLSNAMRIAEFFGVSIDYLSGGCDIRAREAGTQQICYSTGLSENAILNLQIAAKNADKPLSRIKANSANPNVREYETGRYAKLRFINALLEHDEIWEKISMFALGYRYYANRYGPRTTGYIDSPELIARVERESAKEELSKLLEVVDWGYEKEEDLIADFVQHSKAEAYRFLEEAAAFEAGRRLKHGKKDDA